MTVKQLPIISIMGKSFFVDERLKQLRNVNNPHEFYSMVMCETCGEATISDIEGFKAQNCTSCEHYIEECRGATETITLCKECCQEDFIEQGNRNSRAFMGVMTDNREDREESDLQLGEG